MLHAQAIAVSVQQRGRRLVVHDVVLGIGDGLQWGYVLGLRAVDQIMRIVRAGRKK